MHLFCGYFTVHISITGSKSRLAVKQLIRKYKHMHVFTQTHICTHICTRTRNKQMKAWTTIIPIYFPLVGHTVTF